MNFIDAALRWIFDEFMILNFLRPSPFFLWVSEKALVAMDFRRTVRVHHDYTWSDASRYVSGTYEAVPEGILRGL